MRNEVMCHVCNGSGIGASGDTESTCTSCNGTGAEVLRDTKGRFKKYEEHPNDK
jgi:DnaJ-class molecular chaperone